MVEYFRSKPADPAIIERLETQPINENALALDLGCGGGRHSDLLASKGFDTVAVDINPAMLNATRQRLEAKQLPIHLAQMDITRLCFSDKVFDVVVSTGVLHQAKSIEEYDSAVSEVARVLRRGGLFTGNIFTNRVWDETYTVPNEEEPYTVITREGLWMTLLSKERFYEIATSHGLELEREVAEELKMENTGERAVLRFHMQKI